MKKLFIAAFGSIIVLSSCTSSGPKRTVTIFGRGEVTAKGNTITTTDGAGYAEKKLEFTEETDVQLNIQSPKGNTTVTIPKEAGYYLLSLRSDTIVGAQQFIGRDLSNNTTITQEKLAVMIDSLTQLTTGANVNEQNHNFMLLPNQVKKITSNPDAQVFGPFTKIPQKLTAGPNGAAPELYKFYTNNEMRDLIKNFKSMTAAGQ
jgi:hypothetical protein